MPSPPGVHTTATVGNAVAQRRRRPRTSANVDVFGPKQIPERQLRAGIRHGAARSTEQDPLFSLRLLVDVAARGLSPAVNDPFTAVQALDRIAQLLAVLARGYLDEGWQTDRSGTIRLWYATPLGCVLLAFSENRSLGARVTTSRDPIRQKRSEEVETTGPQDPETGHGRARGRGHH
jgi:uncharacterized membrane protein